VSARVFVSVGGEGGSKGVSNVYISSAIEIGTTHMYMLESLKLP
jgi:hypothetical protein